MPLPITLSEIAPRISAGAFILNSGLGKRGADAQTAAALHGFASGTYPILKNLQPGQFVSLLSKSEIAVGAILLTPFVPTAVAGAALTAFSGGLLGLYLRTPGMRKPGSLAPTEQGLAIAKDSWLLGIGIGLADPRHGGPAAPERAQGRQDAGRRGQGRTKEGAGPAPERRRLTDRSGNFRAPVNRERLGAVMHWCRNVAGPLRSCPCPLGSIPVTALFPAWQEDSPSWHWRSGR